MVWERINQDLEKKKKKTNQIASTCLSQPRTLQPTQNIATQGSQLGANQSNSTAPMYPHLVQLFQPPQSASNTQVFGYFNISC